MWAIGPSVSETVVIIKELSQEKNVTQDFVGFPFQDGSAGCS
jgi:hypothetical protein